MIEVVEYTEKMKAKHREKYPKGVAPKDWAIADDGMVYDFYDDEEEANDIMAGMEDD